MTSTRPVITATDARYTLDLCARLAAVTDEPGRTTRLFLSPATRHAHALLTAEMNALGMQVRVDAIGNLRGTYAAAEPDAPILLIGSHIDTVPNAGAYDGVLGVAWALALVRALGGQRLHYAIEIIAFSEEEGIRFALPFLGSRALAGTLGAEELARTDAAGVSVRQALADFGLHATDLSGCAPTPGTFGYLEAHIEQGPVLESLGVACAAVDTIVGQTRLRLTFHGQSNHAGTTPMHLRRDALTAAAQFITFVETFALSRTGLVATVGMLQAQPGAVNIIPGTATLSLDLRHAQDFSRASAVHLLTQAAHTIAQARALTVEIAPMSEQASVALHPGLCDALAASISASGHTLHRMASGAGHDAMIVGPVLPAAMLFLRTPGGLSHHPQEAVSFDDVEAALQTGLHFLLHLDPAAILPERD